MLFNDQHVMVLDADDKELDAGEWSDELDDLARKHGGYVVVINSDPPVIYADYRNSCQCRGPGLGCLREPKERHGLQ